MKIPCVLHQWCALPHYAELLGRIEIGARTCTRCGRTQVRVRDIREGRDGRLYISKRSHWERVSALAAVRGGAA